MKLAFSILLTCLAGVLPPLPPCDQPSSHRLDATAAVVNPTSEPYRSKITLVVDPYTPQVCRLKFYANQHVVRYRLERSEDLRAWRTVESYTGTNDYSHTVPMLRDNQRLVTHLLVRPGLAQQFYRLTILP